MSQDTGAPIAASEYFHGHDGRECGEHRTVGYRAWCHDCHEWCYPKSPCKGCELPALRSEVERLRWALNEHGIDLTYHPDRGNPLVPEI